MTNIYIGSEKMEKEQERLKLTRLKLWALMERMNNHQHENLISFCAGWMAQSGIPITEVYESLIEEADNLLKYKNFYVKVIKKLFG